MRRVALAVVSTVVALVLLLSFKSHTSNAVVSPSAAVSTPVAGSASDSTSSGSPSTSGSAATSTARKTASKRVVTGSAVSTRYGPVQVRITIENGKLAEVSAIDYPNNDPRDAQINSYAIPVLNQEAVAAGNSTINMVSGATYTSEGYIQSLQSALDTAGI